MDYRFRRFVGLSRNLDTVACRAFAAGVGFAFRRIVCADFDREIAVKSVTFYRMILEVGCSSLVIADADFEF